MESYEFDGGVIKYRFPNIPEGIRIVAKVKKDLQKSLGENDSLTEEELIACTIENIEKLVDSIEVDEKELSYDEAMNERKLREPFFMVADAIVGDIFLDEKKKVL